MQRKTLRSSGSSTMRHYRPATAACGFARSNPAQSLVRDGASSVPAPGAPSILTRLLRMFLLASCFALASIPVSAQPTQEEVFRSIGQNVSHPVDKRRLLAVVLGIAGVIALLVVLSHSKRREGRPKGLDHPGKLLKEALRTVPLKPAELKQLKALVQEAKSRDENAPTSPLTLLLCPSVLAREAQRNPQKVNRKVLGGLMKRMGLLRAA